jgi:hypothetical protein
LLVQRPRDSLARSRASSSRPSHFAVLHSTIASSCRRCVNTVRAMASRWIGMHSICRRSRYRGCGVRRCRDDRCRADRPHHAVVRRAVERCAGSGDGARGGLGPQGNRPAADPGGLPSPVRRAYPVRGRYPDPGRRHDFHRRTGRDDRHRGASGHCRGRDAPISTISAGRGPPATICMRPPLLLRKPPPRGAPIGSRTSGKDLKYLTNNRRIRGQ